MPSPFPGMDPYLEHPHFFHGLHDRFVVGMSDFLQPRLPESYFAEISERVWVEVTRRYVEPDVDVLRLNGGGKKPEPAEGGVAVLAPMNRQPVLVQVPHDERKEWRVDIFARREKEELVTSIEVLSLANKTPGTQARKLYRQKQREVLGSDTNLVEIDLLRGGRHTTAVPLDRAVERAGPFDYHICVHPFDRVENFYVYAIKLEDRLPELAVPLSRGEPPIVVDLQAVFDHCYDSGPYHRRIRYAEITPVPPLRPEHAEWATRLLKEKGFLAAG